MAKGKKFDDSLSRRNPIHDVSDTTVGDPCYGKKATKEEVVRGFRPLGGVGKGKKKSN